jgi:hypothetical protein
MNKAGVRFLSYDLIAQKAEEVLTSFNLKREIPVPIEEIAEFGFKVDIIPIPNLQRDFEVDGYIFSRE